MAATLMAPQPNKKSPKSLPDKFEDLRAGMRLRLVERDDEIEIFMLALLARTHAFFLGEPGIAKSMMVETGVHLIGDLGPDDYFDILFMKSTTREDVFGPLALSLLKQDRYKFLPEGYLPVAKIVFGDEFWEANAAIQRALLWATNERKWRNDGQVLPIPLHSMFIASNKMPEGDGLEAIYDRFPLRKIVKRIAEPGNFIGMLKLVSGTKVTQGPVISWTEVEAACAEAETVTIPTDVLEALNDVREQLRQESIYPSDRRFAQALDIVKAAAWLDGADEADIYHLTPLMHVLWTDPEEAPKVRKILLELANPLDKEIEDIMEGVRGLQVELEDAISGPLDEEMKMRAGSQIYEKVEEANDELKVIAAKLKGSKRSKRKLQEANDAILALSGRLLTKLFDTTEEEIDVKVLSVLDDEESK